MNALRALAELCRITPKASYSLVEPKTFASVRNINKKCNGSYTRSAIQGNCTRRVVNCSQRQFTAVAKLPSSTVVVCRLGKLKDSSLAAGDLTSVYLRPCCLFIYRDRCTTHPEYGIYLLRVLHGIARLQDRK